MRHGFRIMIKLLLNSIRNFLLFKVRYPFVTVGQNVHCQWNIVIGPRKKFDICIGNNVGIGRNCLFACDVKIGDKVFLASNVAFVGKNDHIYNKVGFFIWDSGTGINNQIIIEDDVWIGYGVIILSGITVGQGSVVAAGSIVTKNVISYSIVAGNPAKLLKMRFSPNEIIEHELMLK